MCQKLPYLPTRKKILYVPENHEFMQAAKMLIPKNPPKNIKQLVGVVIVKNGKIIGGGNNVSWWHQVFFCVRRILKFPTGKGYWVCPGCHPRTHAEQQAIKNSAENPAGADLYLWGHWWCCESCWQVMIKAEIKNVYLAENAAEKFRS